MLTPHTLPRAGAWLLALLCGVLFASSPIIVGVTLSAWAVSRFAQSGGAVEPHVLAGLSVVAAAAIVWGTEAAVTVAAGWLMLASGAGARLASAIGAATVLALRMGAPTAAVAGLALLWSLAVLDRFVSWLAAARIGEPRRNVSDGMTASHAALLPMLVLPGVDAALATYIAFQLALKPATAEYRYATAR